MPILGCVLFQQRIGISNPLLLGHGLPFRPDGLVCSLSHLPAQLLERLYGQALPIWYLEDRGRQSILSSIDKLDGGQRAQAAREFSPMRLAFMSSSRIVDTTKMREVLHVIPKYADAADGIAASLREEKNL